MKQKSSSAIEGTAAAPDFVQAVEALCSGDPQPEKDRKLCDICLQWTCDGPHCHREGVCPDDAK